VEVVEGVHAHKKGVIDNPSINGQVRVRVDDDDNGNSVLRNFDISNLINYTRGILKGHRVEITKAGNYTGKTARVVNPNWHGRVRIKMDEDGTVKSYLLNEVLKLDMQEMSKAARAAKRWKKAAKATMDFRSKRGDNDNGDAKKSSGSSKDAMGSSSSLSKVHNKEWKVKMMQAPKSTPLYIQQEASLAAASSGFSRRANLRKLARFQTRRDHDFGLTVLSRVHRPQSRQVSQAFSRQNDLLKRI
jgi:hypothetical protein